MPLRTYQLSSRKFFICSISNQFSPNGVITRIRIQSRYIHKQKYSKQSLDPKRDNILFFSFQKKKSLNRVLTEGKYKQGDNQIPSKAGRRKNTRQRKNSIMQQDAQYIFKIAICLKQTSPEQQREAIKTTLRIMGLGIQRHPQKRKCCTPTKCNKELKRLYTATKCLPSKLYQYLYRESASKQTKTTLQTHWMQVADIFMKAIFQKRVDYICNKLGIITSMFQPERSPKE